MDENPLALDFLLEVISGLHVQARNEDTEPFEAEFADIPDDDLKSIIESLWRDRYSSSILTFENDVSRVVNTWVAAP